jgi:hypothetical protein
MFLPRMAGHVFQIIHQFQLFIGLFRIILYHPFYLLALLPVYELRRCSKCLLPETTPYIQFDEEGECNFCKSHQKIEPLGEAALLSLLEKFKKKKGKYECLVPVSGGRDSTYALLKMAKDYKMEVLAVNYENPFTEPQARENIKNAVRILDVDLVSFKLPRNIHVRIFKNSLEALCRKPSSGAFPLICLGCKLMWWEITKIARQNGISCVIGGLNRYEDSTYKKVALGISEKETWEKTFIKAFSGMLLEIIKNPGYLKLPFIPSYIKAYLFGDPYALGFKLFHRKIVLTDLFYYLDWNEQEVLSRISSELNWRIPQSASSSWRFDCKVTYLKDCIQKSLLGLTEKDDFYSKMIREGKISRKEALKRIEQENIVSFEYIEELLSFTDISLQSFQEKFPPRNQTQKLSRVQGTPTYSHKRH